MGDRLGEAPNPNDPQYFEEGGQMDNMGGEYGSRVGTGGRGGSGGMRVGSRGGSAGYGLIQGNGPGGGSSKNPSRVHTAGTMSSSQSKNSSAQSHHRPTSQMYGYGARSHYSLDQQIEDAYQVRIGKQLQLAARVAYQRRQFTGTVGGGGGGRGDRIRGHSPPKHTPPLITASGYSAASLALDESNPQVNRPPLSRIEYIYPFFVAVMYIPFACL